MIHVSADEMVAVGDGVNDYPMFEYAGLALGIGLKEEEKVHHNFKDIMDVMKHLHEL